MIEVGDQFLSRKAQEDDERPGPPKAYHDNWYGGGNLRQLFEVVRAEPLYSGPYGLFSAFHHWEISSIGRSLSWSDDPPTFTFTLDAPDQGVFPVAIQSLFESAEITDRHFRLGGDERLTAFRKSYVGRFSKKRGGDAA